MTFLEETRERYAKHAASCQRRAHASGTTRSPYLDGYTSDEWQAHADESRRLSLLPDEELERHFDGVLGTEPTS